MVVGVRTIEFHIPAAQSLKNKRYILRSLRDRLGRLNLSVAEIEHQDLWQRAVIAVAVVSSDKKVVDRILKNAFDIVERDSRVVVLETRSELW